MQRETETEIEIGLMLSEMENIRDWLGLVWFGFGFALSHGDQAIYHMDSK
jgi:hypothetical protein